MFLVPRLNANKASIKPLSRICFRLFLSLYLILIQLLGVWNDFYRQAQTFEPNLLSMTFRATDRNRNSLIAIRFTVIQQSWNKKNVIPRLGLEQAVSYRIIQVISHPMAINSTFNNNITGRILGKMRGQFHHGGVIFCPVSIFIHQPIGPLHVWKFSL